LITRLKAELNLNYDQIRTAFDILNERNVPPERLGAKLIEIAEQFKELQSIASVQPGDDPKVSALKAEALKAINDGKLDEADRLLSDVEKEQRRDLDRLAVNTADTYAHRGRIALAQLRYREAAEHFANAAALLPPGSAHERARMDYLQSEADALYQQGNEFGDNDALLSAVERYRRLLTLVSRQRAPLDWAGTQMNLGKALESLGAREIGTEKIEEAVAAYRAALEEQTRERVPLDWAMAQINLGSALSGLGEREIGTEKIEEAVAAYRAGLEEWTRERVPLRWATTQKNLGIALVSIGEREGGTVRLEEAVAAYRAALEEITRKRVPLEWATVRGTVESAPSQAASVARARESERVCRQAKRPTQCLKGSTMGHFETI
jgi:tetratricopeptide (TPR) repeat protein